MFHKYGSRRVHVGLYLDIVECIFLVSAFTGPEIKILTHTILFVATFILPFPLSSGKSKRKLASLGKPSTPKS